MLLTGDHRPPNDYERRAELTRRVLTSDEPGPYREAHEDYLVTHLATRRGLLGLVRYGAVEDRIASVAEARVPGGDTLRVRFHARLSTRR